MSKDVLMTLIGLGVFAVLMVTMLIYWHKLNK